MLPLAAAGAPARVRGGLRSARLFADARRQLSALHAGYIRLLIDWAALQPDGSEPADLEAPASGCARAIGPCAPYAGIRAQLEAIASQQHAAGGAGYQVVLVIFGTPAWAARSPAGCEAPPRDSFSRPLSGAGIAGYRTLIRSLLELGAREGVALRWWSPWNEPNDPTFLSPQHDSCAPRRPSGSAPAAYAQMVRAMAAELHRAGGEHQLLLGELNAYQQSAPERTDIAEFVSALPADVLCLGDVWSVHAYASRGAFAPARDPVAVLEAALAARGGCAARAPIWITEAGAGAPHPGDPRALQQGEEIAGCRALASQLARWSGDPRVGVVFQYSFREDPAFPVGLLGPELKRTHAAYRLWLAWTRGGADRREASVLRQECA